MGGASVRKNGGSPLCLPCPASLRKRQGLGDTQMGISPLFSVLSVVLKSPSEAVTRPERPKHDARGGGAFPKDIRLWAYLQVPSQEHLMALRGRTCMPEGLRAVTLRSGNTPHCPRPCVVRMRLSCSQEVVRRAEAISAVRVVGEGPQRLTSCTVCPSRCCCPASSVSSPGRGPSPSW